MARNRGQELSDEQASIAYKLHLDPLPCWQHWSAKRYQRQIAELLQHIEQEALERHERDETAPLGVAEILAQHPHAAPDKMKRAPG